MYHFSLANEERQIGWNEDGPRYGLVYFITATKPDGHRWIGPLLPRNEVEQLLQLSQEQLQDTLNARMASVDPENSDDWLSWFPVYGSDAYVGSGQGEWDAQCEKNGEPYSPAT